MTVPTIEFHYICMSVRDHSGIELEADKEYLAQSRIVPIALEAGFKTYPEFIAFLRAETLLGPWHRRVIEAMMTNETYFFREPATFDVLKDQIFPEIIKRKAAEKQIVVLSAACSTGQETYSIAISIHDQFPSVVRDWKLTILGADYSRQNLNKAKAGTYSKGEMGRGLTNEQKLRYFTETKGQWTINSAIKDMVTFRELNLTEAWGEIPPIDVLFLRNVLIYFDAKAKKNIYRRVAQALHPAGYLILGNSETTIGVESEFRRERLGSVDVYRR